MKLLRAACVLAALLAGLLEGEPGDSAQNLQSQLRSLSLDPQREFEVRDLRLRRGDVSIYLNQGRLIFARPVAGRCMAAVFTTFGEEAGDAELVLMPPRPSERASLAAHTGSPNLDEHFSLAVFLFSDSTEQQVAQRVAELDLPHPKPLADDVLGRLDTTLRRSVSGVAVSLVETLLDAHPIARGTFIAAVLGRTVGPFEFLFDPDAFEPVSVGSIDTGSYKLWTEYRPSNLPPFTPEQATLEQYSLDATINEDLSLSVQATFTYRPRPYAGRAIPLSLSAELHVQEATLNGTPVEFLQEQQPWTAGADPRLLLVSPGPLRPESRVQISIRYTGALIRRVGSGAYFVSERSLWYPYASSMLANFDLTFHCPERFNLVSTGELIEEHVEDHIRTVHRRTAVPEQLAGFNLGRYTVESQTAAGYRVNCYADAVASKDMNGVPKATSDILEFYNHRWERLPFQSIAVTPVPGYFGQGFPGLIYLSEIAYVHENDRPAALRSARGDNFFSRILLPHEIAHQWWGNQITAADYRSAWLMEAMANYSALEYISQADGAAASEQILQHFRDDLISDMNGKQIDSYGPVDFGSRIFNDAGQAVWHTVIYEKGCWVLRMLEQRLGAARFRELQQKLLTAYSNKPVTNEEFRTTASAFVPAGQPDRTLSRFFDTWVYGTGVPRLKLAHRGADVRVTLSGVDESFIADLPLRCAGRTRWMTVVSGDNVLASPEASFCSLPKESEFLYVRQ